MGVAAYNRGTKAISEQIGAAARPAEFVLMADLNAMPKNNSAKKPWGPIHFISGHGGWWATCPVTGFGYWYETLWAAVRAWRVTIIEFRNGTWVSADPSFAPNTPYLHGS